jgi:hypothetical protein
MSFVLIVFITVALGMLDFGVGVFRYHILAQAARQGARRAIVHGERANVLGVWGPTTIDVAAAASGIPIVDGSGDGIQTMLVGCNLAQTRVRVEWLNGSNELNDPVRVTVSSPYQPVLAFIFSGGQRTLSASSTMQIAH